MNRILFFLFVSLCFSAQCQSYPPAPGQVGSTAMFMDSSAFVAWAIGCEVIRGPRQINDSQSLDASFGEPINAIGKAQGTATDVVSLGDGGQAILNFNRPIKNGPGPDFAVFENAFDDNYMEFAFVEVSSNGIDYVRFPSFSETPASPQQSNASYGDCRYVHNLAGKYRARYGTPFDLNDLIDSTILDLDRITHVKLTDAVGFVDSTYGTFDVLGRLINDPFPTNFESGGFDLDGVGVMHEAPVGLNELNINVSIFPNPTSNYINVDLEDYSDLVLTSLTGQELFAENSIKSTRLDLSKYRSGIYILKVVNELGIKSILIQKE
ncbi:MAG: hypothetical protein ACI9XP_001271 [Lentimonas sp.]|jgi:hypothetical protein